MKPEDIARRKNKKDAESGKKPVLMADLQVNSEPQKAPALPAMTDDDLNFAKSVFNEYHKIPFEPLCQLIREIRHDLRKYQTDFNAGMLSMDLNFWNLLCSDDIEFTAVTIESNKGQIRIPASSEIFKYYFLERLDMLKAFRTLRTNVNETMAKGFNYFYEYIIFMKVWRFVFPITDLIQHKQIATGKILQYFQLCNLPVEANWIPHGSYEYYPQEINDRIRKIIDSPSVKKLLQSLSLYPSRKRK